MSKIRFPFVCLLAVLVLSACSGEPRTGAVAPKWDRDSCERCRMVLSDRFHSAQVRYRAGEERSKVRLFDDIGCALIWLGDKPWRDDSKTEIWVNKQRTGDWIDARSETMNKGQQTPMEFGLGAQAAAHPEGLSLAEAEAHILEVEKRFNAHGVHLRETGDARSEADNP